MQGSYDLQQWLIREYSNENIDFSPQGMANQCIEYVEDMENRISELKIDQEIKGELHVNLESLKKKLNELVSGLKD
jgi:nuclear transport factor 2 (NTF2) superfamily protein